MNRYGSQIPNRRQKTGDRRLEGSLLASCLLPPVPDNLRCNTTLPHSHDNGATWHDHAKSAATFHPYAIGGCRDITDDGYIIGSFTDPSSSPQSLHRDTKAYFFRIKTMLDLEGIQKTAP